MRMMKERVTGGRKISPKKLKIDSTVEAGFQNQIQKGNQVLTLKSVKECETLEEAKSLTAKMRRREKMNRIKNIEEYKEKDFRRLYNFIGTYVAEDK